MPGEHDPNALWLALNEQSDGTNLFNAYPKLLAELLRQEDAARLEGDTSEAEKLVLPSDKEWRLQQYFLLVAMQKSLETDAIKDDAVNKCIRKNSDDIAEEWAPWNLVVCTKNPNAPPPVAIKTTPGPAWDIGQVLKAARLLHKPPLEVDFADEQEMRCVYSLIYDVFRYKSILDQAIEDIDFFGNFPQYSDHRHVTWLFLMELARRKWGARTREELERTTALLGAAGAPFEDIESSIWEQRVHFAAAIARIRIKNRAYTLSDLLPAHLRDECVSACVNKDTVTGWVNTFKAKKVALLVQRLHELGYSYSCSRQLCAGEYRFDRVCPRFITLRPPDNLSIGQLELVKNGVIVLQEREFCEGASTLCRALRANSLQGAVAQTHASSPRCSAYLAAQLRDLAAVVRASRPPAPATPELGRLVVFGAGDKVGSYVSSLRELGIEASGAESEAAVRVLSEPVHGDSPLVASALDGVVAALATPPNSYSAVTDPIDLVCGRGGDLAMLEILTESEMDVKGKARVQSILEEQKRTLKTLMSKPQIQLILYETHSALQAENEAQVTRAVAEANRLARERHALLRRKHKVQKPKKEAEALSDSSESDINSDEHQEDLTDCTPNEVSDTVSSPATEGMRPDSGRTVLTKRTENSEVAIRPGTTKSRPIPDVHNTDDDFPRDPDKDSPDVYVPNCDLFEVQTLPSLGNGLDINYILDRDGCYLGLIQRKELTRLDAKYMIRVAEERGLFGAAASGARRKRVETPATAPRRRRRKHSFEVERIAAPTYASAVRSARRAGASDQRPPEPLRVCSRHARRVAAADYHARSACVCDARHRLEKQYVGRTKVFLVIGFEPSGERVQIRCPFANRIAEGVNGVCIRRVRSSQGCASADGGGPEAVAGAVAGAGSDSPRACRRPFPLAVHELRLSARQRKLAAS
ncbi:unnamed protein product, partial [Iphiclides podalirius]